MATTRKKPRAKGRLARVGLAACGSSGAWRVDVDETVRGRALWFVQIEGPTIYLYFAIPSPRSIRRALQFLDPLATARAKNGNGSLRIGRFGREPVVLVRDNEGDRYFLRIGGGSPAIFVTLVGPDLEALRESLRQVQDDLTEPS